MLHKYVNPDSVCLLNARIVFLFSALVHLVVTAAVTLSIDTTVDKDPDVRAYYYTRWKLLTCWFNLIALVYLPTTLYCNWRIRKGEGNNPLVVKLRYNSDVVMTGILWPITMFADIMFWSMYLTDPSLLGPPRIFHYLPDWSQHSLHTVSLLMVLIELVLTPRTRPISLKPRAAMLMSFTAVYTGTVYYYYTKGDYVYSLCDGLTTAHFVYIFIFAQALMLTLFATQWAIIDFLWGSSHNKKID